MEIIVRRIGQDVACSRLDNPKQVAVFMWGKDTAYYEFSLGGCWHKFGCAELSDIRREVKRFVCSYRLAEKRRLAASVPAKVAPLTWRDALPR